MGSVIGYQEAHGPVATFETDVAGKIKNLVVDINPVQSGTGDPSPDNIRPITGWAGAKVTKCGKNVYNISRINMMSYRGVMIERVEDKLHVYGTATESVGFAFDNFHLMPGSYIYSSTTENLRMVLLKGYTQISGTIPTAFTVSSVSDIYRFRLQIVSGTTYDFYISKVQIELGSTATAYEPYVGSTYDITFPSAAGTVYGGKLDVVKGELVVDRAIVDMGTLSYGLTGANRFYNTSLIPGFERATTSEGRADGLVCSIYKPSSNLSFSDAQDNCSWLRGMYSSVFDFVIKDEAYININDFKTAMSGVQLVYGLHTPITYQLTPQEVSTIIGTNTIYADTGDTSVIYPKTITPIETVSNVNLMKLRRSIMVAMQHNYIPEITTYGVEWNYSDPSTILTRTGNAANFNNPIPAESLSSTGSSPFDSIYPWSEMKRYNIINGEVAYSQDDAGYSETNYDTVVYIPTFYYKAQKDTTNQKWNWNISDKPIEGYEKHPGSGRYVGRFHTSGSSSGVFSKGGVTPLANTTRANFRTYSHNKGSNWWQIDLATWSAIQMLYLVEFANWNSQDVLGGGQNSGNLQNTGATTGATYHTITRNNASNAYHWIENPFSNVYTWVDGYVVSSKASYITTDPASYGESTTCMENVGITLPNSKYITGLGYSEKCAWAFIPNAASGGSASTYIPDYVSTGGSSASVLCVGGLWFASNYYGAFYFDASNSATDAGAVHSSRLIYIPTT